jgi:hypothetical protein
LRFALHRRRSVIVRMTPEGEQLGWVRLDNDPVALGVELAKAGPDPEVALEATYGWYWAVDALQAAGARVHLAHPLGIKGFTYRGGPRPTCCGVVGASVGVRAAAGWFHPARRDQGGP